MQSVLRKIEEVTRVPTGHYESFQVLKYGLGQRYTTHHDYGREDVKLACGPRILTFFLYLSDVEEGGETVRGRRRCAHYIRSMICCRRFRALILRSSR